MTSGFSAGPWRFDTEDVHSDACVLAADLRHPKYETHVICFGHDYDEYGQFGLPKHFRRKAARSEKEAIAECEANQRLILKAPELFGLLHRLVDRGQVSMSEIRELLSWIETGATDLEGSRDD